MNGAEGLTISDWVNDTLVAFPALQTALRGSPGDISARVGEGVLPKGTAYPLVSFTTGPEGQVVAGVGEAEIMARFLVQVKAVTTGSSYVPLRPVVLAIKDALYGKTNQVTPWGTVLTVQRTGVIQYPETTDGIQYRHLGGLYVIQAQ